MVPAVGSGASGGSGGREPGELRRDGGIYSNNWSDNETWLLSLGGRNSGNYPNPQDACCEHGFIQMHSQMIAQPAVLTPECSQDL